MSRNWTLLPLILFLGSTGTLQAATARFSRRRLYRRTTLQPRVPGLYGLVLPGVVGPAPRGTRDHRRGAARSGIRTGRTGGPPACGKTCRAGCPHRAARRQGGVERQGAQHQGVEQQEDRRAQSLRLQQRRKAMPPATAAVTPAKACRRDHRSHSEAGAQGGERQPPAPAQTAAIAPSQPAAAPAPEELASKVAGTRGQARGKGRSRIAAAGDARCCRSTCRARSRYGARQGQGDRQRPHPHRSMIRTIWSRSC